MADLRDRRLRDRDDIVRALVTYTDWWQPSSGSVIHLRSRGEGHGDGLPSGLLESLHDRMDLCERMQLIPERDRYLLYLWYVEQQPVDLIAKAVGISRRQCFRVRNRAIDRIVDPERFETWYVHATREGVSGERERSRSSVA